MLLKHIESVGDYLNHLRTHKEELDALYEDLLITVTEFFRDPGVFDFLKSEIIPGILKTLPPDTPARVWVPGCASGEEAYSIAICFVEASKDRAGPPVQVFATDVSEHSIRKARQAIYQKNIATSVSPERLQRFFVKEAGGYHINKLIRDMCIFAEQNVIADAPFSRIDLVSCRNLMIYLDTSTQKDVLHRFHYALKPTGSLLLGTSESTAAAPQLFEQVHKPERVYAKVHITGRIDFALVGRSPIHGPLAKAPVAVARPVRDIGNEIDQLLLRRFGPSGVLLNSEMEILQFRGSTGGLLEPASGEASLNVFRMIRKELAEPLHVALHEARMSYTPIHKRDLEVPVNGHTMRLDLEVSRLRPEPKGETYYLVLFEVPRTIPRPGTRKKVPTPPAYRRVSELEEKLKSAHEMMRSITEEEERTNLALQSANEEILANNEELQSMNEEMHIAREEIQATNNELQKRNTQLGEAYSDLNNLILSLGIASVLVDDELRILRFTPVAQKILNLIPNDVGRRITDMRSNINVSDLPGRIAEVIRTMSATEVEVQDTDGHWYTMCIRPYKTDSGRIAGAVMFLVSIDGLKRMQAALTESDEKWQELIDEPPDFILTPDGRILLVNQEFVSQTSNAKVGTSMYEAVETNDRAALKKTLETVCKTGQASAVKVTGTGTGPLHRAVLESVLMPIRSRGKLIALMMRTKPIQPIASQAALSNALTR